MFFCVILREVVVLEKYIFWSRAQNSVVVNTTAEEFVQTLSQDLHKTLLGATGMRSQFSFTFDFVSLLSLPLRSAATSRE